MVAKLDYYACKCDLEPGEPGQSQGDFFEGAEGDGGVGGIEDAVDGGAARFPFPGQGGDGHFRHPGATLEERKKGVQIQQDRRRKMGIEKKGVTNSNRTVDFPMKASLFLFLVSVMLFDDDLLSASPYQDTVLQTIALSPTASLVVRRLVEKIPPLPTPPKLTLPLGAYYATLVDSYAVNVTYVLTLRSNTIETKLDKAVFFGTVTFSKLLDGSKGDLGFSILDAQLIDNTLLCLYDNNGELFLGTSKIDASGKASDFQRKKLPTNLLWKFDTGYYVPDKDGKSTIAIRDDRSQAGRAFDFARDASLFSVVVPVTSASSSPSSNQNSSASSTVPPFQAAPSEEKR